MSELSKLLESKLPVANLANLANPTPEISNFSNFSSGVIPNTHLVPHNSLRVLAGPDWPEISADPLQLDAFRVAAETAKRIRFGIVPDHYTNATNCKHCGPVPIFPGCPPQVDGCPWCFADQSPPPIPEISE